MAMSDADAMIMVEKEEVAKSVDIDMSLVELCLPCEDEAYEDILDFRRIR